MKKVAGGATGSEVRVQPVGGGAMLYDGSRASNAQEGWLSPGWWQRRGTVTAASGGRGSAWMIASDARLLVLRHYQRGGFLAGPTDDRYWWHGPEATRSFSEWRLLYRMRRMGLPVPVPVAACYRRQGSRYTADILMEQLPGTQTLAQRIRATPLALLRWVDIGRCIRRFVDAGIWHADLNAHNILLDGQDTVWLIDFDRGRQRRPGLWGDAMLARLFRSVQKLAIELPADRFGTNDWHSLVDAYLAGNSPPRGEASGVNKL